MLLKAIEEKCYRPLGAAKDEHSDFQIICGTNGPLDDPTKFRNDLLTRINLWRFRLPGLAARREDIEPNLDYEIECYAKRTGKHISFNSEARQMFLDFSLDPANTWPGNFRDLNAMVVRMATLADGGRITTELVEEEIARSAPASPAKSEQTAASASDLAALLGKNYREKFDEFDLVQFARVVEVCRESSSAADAARKLFAVSMKAKSSSNSSDRLIKYLARFGLKFKDL